MNRIDKVASQIRHNVCDIIQKELKDPRVGFITITEVRLSPDLQIAKIYFTVLGEGKQKEDSVNGLKRAAGFIRKELSVRIKMRKAPVLDFRLDEVEDYGRNIEELFKKINEARKNNAD